MPFLYPPTKPPTPAGAMQIGARASCPRITHQQSPINPAGARASCPRVKNTPPTLPTTLKSLPTLKPLKTLTSLPPIQSSIISSSARILQTITSHLIPHTSFLIPRNNYYICTIWSEDRHIIKRISFTHSLKIAKSFITDGVKAVMSTLMLVVIWHPSHAGSGRYIGMAWEWTVYR